MNRRYLVIPALLLLAVLTACEITITVDPPPPGVRITSSGYGTDIFADADGDGRLESVICDDRTTLLSYHFDYAGELRRWTSFLEGVQTGQVRGEATFYPGDPRVSFTSSSVDVTYEIRPGAAPLAREGAGTTAGLTADIIVVPLPNVIGYTQLKVRVNGNYNSTQLTSDDIPVLASCS